MGLRLHLNHRDREVRGESGIYPQKGRRVLACHVMPGTEKLIFDDEGRLTEILYAGMELQRYRTFHFHTK